jgi:hypothetical protein
MIDPGAADLDREAGMGTWGTGPFSSDGALDLLDVLGTQPASQRREALERIFSESGTVPACWDGSSSPMR